MCTCNTLDVLPATLRRLSNTKQHVQKAVYEVQNSVDHQEKTRFWWLCNLFLSFLCFSFLFFSFLFFSFLFFSFLFFNMFCSDQSDFLSFCLTPVPRHCLIEIPFERNDVKRCSIEGDDIRRCSIEGDDIRRCSLERDDIIRCSLERDDVRRCWWRQTL